MAAVPDSVAGLPRRLIALLDGTWSAAETQTNVERLWKLIAAFDGAGRRQIAHYLPGVGVKPGLEHLLGGAFGLGLADLVKQGYQWLAQEWREADEVWLFGFSRGAYAARSLSGMIHRCGLLQPDAQGHVAVEEAYAFYRQDVAADDTRAAAFRQQQHSRTIEVQCIGVWETVGELGIPEVGSWFPYARSRYRFHDTELSGNVRCAIQALALDEHRADFAPTKWTTLPRSNATIEVEQRWFVGSHSDVGGGDQTDGAGHSPDLLPDITLAWMQHKAAQAGLAFSEPFAALPESYLATPNDSYKQFMYGLYKMFKHPFNRVIGGGLNETVDDSVWQRWQALPGYRPPALVNAIADGVVKPPRDFVRSG